MTNTSWPLHSLDELGTVERGKSRHRPRNDPELYGGPYPFIQTAEVTAANLYISDYAKTYSEKGLAQSRLWKPGILCIVNAGENTATNAILNINACFPDSIIAFEADPKKSNVKFIKYYLDIIKPEIRQVTKGTTQDNLSVQKLLNFQIPTPPIEVQNEISGVLSAYDDLIENNNHRIAILEDMAQSLYREWFIKFSFPDHENTKFTDSPLGKIPEGWEVVGIEELIKRYQTGKKYNNKTALSEGSIPILDQGKSGIIGYHSDEPGVMASEDDPIIVFANHTCYQKIIQYPFSAIQNVLPFKPIDGERERDLYWLHYSTKNVIEFNDYKGHWPEFMSKKVVLPPKELCSNFGEFTKHIETQKYKLECQIDVLKKQRDLLLPKLISGIIAL